jgi:hypothetical protein
VAAAAAAIVEDLPTTSTNVADLHVAIALVVKTTAADHHHHLVITTSAIVATDVPLHAAHHAATATTLAHHVDMMTPTVRLPHGQLRMTIHTRMGMEELMADRTQARTPPGATKIVRVTGEYPSPFTFLSFLIPFFLPFSLSHGLHLPI